MGENVRQEFVRQEFAPPALSLFFVFFAGAYLSHHCIPRSHIPLPCPNNRTTHFPVSQSKINTLPSKRITHNPVDLLSTKITPPPRLPINRPLPRSPQSPACVQLELKTYSSNISAYGTFVLLKFYLQSVLKAIVDTQVRVKKITHRCRCSKSEHGVFCDE